MSISKEANGTWTVQCYYNDWTGKKKHKKKRGFTTKKEAAEWERKFLLRSTPLEMKLEDFVNLYYEDVKNGLKYRSVHTKKSVINRHILPYFGERPINSITAPEIIKWQNCIMELGYKPTYLRSIQNQLTAIFTHASEIYDLENNPCKKVEKMGEANTKRIDFWTKDEYDCFIQLSEPGSKYYVLFETLFWTGMRIGELLALTKADIDTVKGVIHITKTYCRKDRMDLITEPKTRESVRDVDIPEFLATELQEYMDRLYGLKDEERVFPIVAEAVQHAMKRRIAKTELKKITVHDLRHSHVAYLIDKDVQPFIIKERLGHADIKMTLNTYGHLYPSKQKKLVEMLNEKR